MRRHSAILLGALACVATGALAMGALGAGADSPQPAIAPGGQAPVAEASADQRANFAALRRGRVVSDGLPQSAVTVVDRGPGPRLGVNGELSRRVFSRSDGWATYLAPGHDWLCLLTSDGGGACNRTDEALHGYLLLAQQVAPNSLRVVGALPDGAKDVIVTAADGVRTAVSVEANAFQTDLPTAGGEVAWRDGSGADRTVPIPGLPAEP
jgi:hypothetical protein